jgi:hypothetical protein
VPDQGTAEQPVELRAGPGVRLHGYGGIHTLERLPVLTEVLEVPPQIASLTLEVEIFEGYSRLCYVDVDVASEEFIITRVYTYYYEHGSYVVTHSASGDIAAWGAGDSTPEACDSPEYSSTYDPDFNLPDGYGNYISEEQTQTTVPFISLFAPARDALAILSSTTDTFFAAYPRSEWQAISEEVTPFTYNMGRSIATPPDGSQTVRRIKYRLRNTGNVALRVNHGFYGSGITGGAANELFDTTLSRGAETGWFDSAIPDADPDKWRDARIERVRIGRYLSVP